jgi:hypothetical protein
VEAAPEGDRRRWSTWRRSRPKGMTARLASSGSRHKLLSDEGSAVLRAKRRWVRRPITGACGVRTVTHRGGRRQRRLGGRARQRPQRHILRRPGQGDGDEGFRTGLRAAFFVQELSARVVYRRARQEGEDVWRRTHDLGTRWRWGSDTWARCRKKETYRWARTSGIFRIKINSKCFSAPKNN